MNELKEKEKCLLKHLRKNARKSLTQISEETEIPVSTLFALLKKLEKSVIDKHTSLLDFPKMGYSIKVHFVLDSEKRNELKSFLMSHKNVNSLYSLINDHDFYVECIFKDLSEMANFKEALYPFKMKTINQNFIVEEIKREEFVV